MNKRKHFTNYTEAELGDASEEEIEGFIEQVVSDTAAGVLALACINAQVAGKHLDDDVIAKITEKSRAVATILLLFTTQEIVIPGQEEVLEQIRLHAAELSASLGYIGYWFNEALARVREDA